MHQPLYNSYWPGMTAEKCGVQSRELPYATDSLQRGYIESLVYSTRKIKDDYYESCWYQVPVEPDKWKDGSVLEIFLDAETTAEMYVYAGTDRRNVTTVVDSNQTLTLGAPVRIPVSYGGAIVVLQVDRTANSAGNAGFSYQIDGLPYSWYEMYFVGYHYLLFWVFRVVFGILLLVTVVLVLAAPIGIFGVSPLI